MNRYPLWKYILIIFVVTFAGIYALPNIYDKDPSLQVGASAAVEISELTEILVTTALDEAGLKAKAIDINVDSLTVRFDDVETQLKAKEVVTAALGSNYVIALNLAPATPDWLRNLGAEPMFLGLDLRGGVHFLMEVDMPAAVRKAEDRYVSDLRTMLRENKVRYKTIGRQASGGVLIRFRGEEQKLEGVRLIEKDYAELTIADFENDADEAQILVTIIESSMLETQRLALQQNITILRKRVNELGVAEPVIQQQGLNRIVVQMPGVQDPTIARIVIGSTATLEYRMVDEEHSVQDALDGRVPAGSKLFKDRAGRSYLLRKQVMITGDYIIDAASGIDQQSGGPSVTVRLDGKGAKIFAERTRDEVGKAMAVVFIENKTETVKVKDGYEKKKKVVEEIISVATIREQLGKVFQTTGLDSSQEARNLALLLRAGALAAPIEIIEERTVGPSLGQDNIDKGFNSVIIGFTLVLIFMLFYYRVFGIAANVALALNLVLIVAMLSLLQATLTLPGIAGIVLTVGMAVDANVLIFQRIREEIKNGNSPQASIHSGYEKAFSTIADANITTLIAALVLFSFGTGPIKGFAVTLSLGIISSMFTAIVVTRGIINAIYGGKKVQKLSI
jgi:preprotein translocase subunit SecD